VPPEPEPVWSIAVCIAWMTTGFWPWPR
jgi:hypothetical protein